MLSTKNDFKLTRFAFEVRQNLKPFHVNENRS